MSNFFLQIISGRSCCFSKSTIETLFYGLPEANVLKRSRSGVSQRAIFDSTPAVNREPGFRRENSQSFPNIKIFENIFFNGKILFEVSMIFFLKFSFFDIFLFICSASFLNRKRYYLIPIKLNSIIFDSGLLIFSKVCDSLSFRGSEMHAFNHVFQKMMFSLVQHRFSII